MGEVGGDGAGREFEELGEEGAGGFAALGALAGCILGKGETSPGK